MYSGTSLTKFSGRVIGAHQKIDRVSRKQLDKILPDSGFFPTSKDILYFEGKRGPDAIKIKSPAKDEPWHYFDPFDDKDTQILDLINDHYLQLTKEIKAHNTERIAFEAAWMAHAIVDGLTPAHHYPYEKKLVELRGGEGIESRTTFKSKLFMPGLTKREKFKNNWEMWGSKGLMTTHMSFEFGVASIFAPLSFSDALPTLKQIESMEQMPVTELFTQIAREIAVLDMYTRYYTKGWTPKLAYEVRHKLGPLIIQCVSLSWYKAILDAKAVKPQEVYENYKRNLGRKNVSST